MSGQFVSSSKIGKISDNVQDEFKMMFEETLADVQLVSTPWHGLNDAAPFLHVQHWLRPALVPSLQP